MRHEYHEHASNEPNVNGERHTMTESRGLARSNSSWEPPTMNVSVPFSAPPTPAKGERLSGKTVRAPILQLCKRTAGHGSVHHGHLVLRGLGNDAARNSGLDGGSVDEEGTLLDAVEDAVLGGVYLLHVGRGRKHGHQLVDLARHFTRSRGSLGTLASETLHGTLVDVEHHERVAGLQDVLCHEATHVAQSNKTNGLRRKISISHTQNSS